MKFFSSTNGVTRFSAWVVLQALVVTQLLPPSAAWALRGQSPGETAVSAGLEESLVTQPAKGFTTRVDRQLGDGVQSAGREVGRLVATAVLSPGAIGALEPASGAGDEDIQQAAAARRRALEGMEWMAARHDLPVIASVLERLGDKRLKVEFRANHGMTLDLGDDDATVRFDTTVAQALETEGDPAGRRTLYGLGLLHEAAQAAGYSTRASIHLLIAAYESLPAEERQQLHALLRSPFVDHGGIWDFFFQQVADDRQFQGNATRAQKKLPATHLSDKDIQGVDTITLMDRRDAAGASAQEQARLDWVIDYRDTWVSWLTGMLQFDIPFDYQKFMQIYRDPAIDLDTKRQLLFEVLRGYSREAERGNAERVARDAAERGQILIGGRYSTAFVDEANEVASAEFVVATDELREAALELVRFAEETRAAAAGDRAAENAAEILVRSAEGLMTAVLKSGGVTRGEVMRYLDIEDHVGEVYGALEKCQVTLSRAVDGAQAEAQRRHEMEARVRGREFSAAPFDSRRQAVENSIRKLRALADAARAAFLRAPRQPYARMVALQRPSPTGAINFAHGIGFAKKAGQAPNLRERVRTGGQNSWMSPDTVWVEWVNYMVEFIPLFIGERILRFELPDGRQVDRREVEVDQKQLESAIRGMADPFAADIERTMTSEYVALAREAVCEARLGARVIDSLAAERKVSREEAYRLAVRESSKSERLVREIAEVAAGIAARAEREAERIEQAMVDAWAAGPQPSRFDILRRAYLFDPEGTARYGETIGEAGKELGPRPDRDLLKRYEAEALEPRRPLPMWIMGTTEAPGLTESFCMGWLEEEMALRNVIRAKGHERDVQELMKEYRAMLVETGRVVLREFGYDRQIDARAAERGVSPEEAVLDLIGENETLQREVAKLAVLRLWAREGQKGYAFSAAAPDPEPVVRKLEDAGLRPAIDAQARQIVWLQNRSDLQADVDAALKNGAPDFDAALKQVIEAKQVLGQRPYEAHWQSARRWVARDMAIRELELQPEAMRWYRDHTALARTTARQTVVDRYNLRDAMTDPRGNYQSDGVYLSESDTWAPSPWKMRYLIAAGPSQVDLGGEDTTSRQLKSISLWPKWGGVVSQAGEEALRKFYGAYHYRLEIRRLDQAEDMKVLKNSRTAMNRAVMNLISAVTVNDVQDVAIQTRTHGDPLGDMFAYQDPDKAGASAGYCIPKDILFKVFVSQLQDAQALSYVGVPDAQVPEALALIRRVWAARGDYDTEIEWERWATAEMIALNESFKQYVDLGGRGVLVFNVTRIAKVLDRLGVPSAYPGGTQDLYRGLVASVAAERIALLETVNRLEAFRMPVDLFDAIAKARELNPGASLTPDGQVTMQMPAPYKGTGKGSQHLADVRYSRWLMAAYLMSILPGVPPQAGLEEATDLETTAHRLLEPLTASLRPQDEALFQLGMRGFRPESENPADRLVTRFVAERLMGINRRSVETLPGFVEARKAIPPEAPDYLDRLEALVTEWIARTAAEDKAYAPQVAQLRARFPARLAPARITITASPQTAVGDVLGHITEKDLWESAADEALAILMAHKLTLQEIRARAKSGDPFHAWIAHLPVEEQRQITEQVGGRHIPLAIREGGLGTNFWQDIQGRDVVVLGVPYDANLRANPAHIIQSMRRGNPGFLGVISDHSVQGRPRVWHGHRQWAPDVMLAYAAGLAFDKEGRPITDWTRRAREGRRIVYVANSLPAGNPIIETWRKKEMEMEGRSIRLFQALQAVAAAGSAAQRRAAVDRALEIFRQEVPLSAIASEFDQVRSYEREVGPDGLNLFRERDRAMSAGLGALLRGMNEAVRQRGDAALWLGQATRAEVAALGLMFLLNGETQERIDEALGTVDKALALIRKELDKRGLTLDTKFQQPITTEQAAAWTGLLIEPQLQVEISQKSRKQVEASSVKAPETVNKALAARAALVLQAEREVHLARRGAGYRQVMEGLVDTQDPGARWEEAVSGARQEMEAAQAALGSADPAGIHTHTGRLFAWMQTAGHAAVDQWVPDAQERLNWHEQINALTRGRELNESAWAMFTRLQGLLPRLFELAGKDPQRRAQVGALMEMADAALALEKMAPYFTMDRAYINEPALWLDLLGFFGVTINDHFDQRLPWAVSTARGNGFQELFNAQERLLDEGRKDFDLYRFAWDSHAWLYGFLRQLMVSKTQLADMPADRRDQLLGVMAPEGPALPPIGGGAPAGDDAMQLWRGYLQLREIGNWCQTSVAMLQDTFRPLAEQVGPVNRAMMPYVFAQPVDPGLVGADTGAGLVIMSGIGRPHYQQMMREGADPDLGDNIFITQHGRFLTPEGRAPGNPQEFDRSSLWIDDAHFWVPLETFREMLMQTEGMTEKQADAKIAELQAAKQIHPKGVRVAARFTRPVAVGAAVTLHGHYIEPQLQQAGYPTAEKSGVLFEVTYGKIYGPEIVAGRPLSYPAQENIYQQETLDNPPAETRAKILAQVQAYAAKLGSPAFFVKGSRESGSRNLQYFDAVRPDGSTDPAVIAAAAEFAYQVSTGQDVVLSDDQSLRNSNQTFLTPEIVESMRARAVREYGIDVNLNEPGKADVTTVRVTVVSPRPDVPYEPAHVLLITSYTGRVTNMARQNVAEPLLPEFLRPEVRDDFLQGLMTSAPEAMRAMADFTRRFWHDGVTLPDDRQFPAYKEVYRQQHGEYPKEFDARGVPYWYPTWLMLDYIASATFESVKDGKPLPAARIVDIDPGDPKTGAPPVFTLRDGQGNRVQGRVTGHVPWLLEWNTGIGQIPEYNRREQYWEYARARGEAAQAGEPENWFDRVNWGHVGVADRKALKTWLAEARETRAAKGFPAGWPEAPAPPALAPTPVAPAVPAKPVRVDPLAATLRGVRSRLGATPLTEETLSLWLSAYALRRMGPVLVERRQRLGDPAAYEQTAGAVTSDVLAMLQDGQLRQEMAELIEEESIPVSADRLGELLQGNSPQAQSYRERIALQVLGDVMANPQTVIPVAVLPEPLSPETVAARLTQPNRMAVVVGKELRMDHAVEPFALSAIGRPVDVLGVHTDWVTEDGEVTRVQVYDPAGRICWECPLTRPMRLPREDHPGATPRAYIVDLPQEGELGRHQEITRRLRAGGIEPVNPAGEAQARADDKAFLLSQSDPDRVHWNLVARSATPSQVRSRVSGFIGAHPGERVVVKPRAGTTGAEGVRVIEPGPAQAEQAAAAITALQGQGQKEGHDVVLERFWGNVTMGGREFVVRSNVSAGEIQSGNALVAPYGERVVSTNRGAVALSTEDVLDHLIGPAGTVAISPERMAELDAEAVAAAQRISQGVPLADRLGMVALDRRFWVDGQGQVQQAILEANARGGGFIAAEPTAVASSFWREMGLHQAPSLLQWENALAGGAPSQETLQPHYSAGAVEAKQAQLAGWMRSLSELRTPSGEPAFDESRGTLLTRTPGRVQLPPGGRHLDYIGMMGGSLGMPTLQEVCAFVQEVDGMRGNVEAYAIDAPDPAIRNAYPQEGHGPRVVSLSHPWLNPDRPIRTLAEWDAWASAVWTQRREARAPDTKVNYADDLLAALIAFLRTDFGDPSGRARAYFDQLEREGKGLRFAFASDLPAGGGLSSSSAVLEGAAQALNDMAGIGLTVEQLVHLGYAERFYAGTQGGVRDHAHFMYPPAFLGVAPTRLIETLPVLPDTNVLLIDSGVSRDNAPNLSAKLQQTGDDEQNIKGRTGVGYALACLWLRQQHPELEPLLRPNQDPSNPYGFMRELMPNNENGLPLQQIYQLLREIPAEGLTRGQMYESLPAFKTELDNLFQGRPEPPRPYPLREMTLFALAEEARILEAVRVLRQMEQGVPLDTVFRQMLEVIRTAHNGDRVARYSLTDTGGTGLQVEQVPWDWHMSDERLDQMITHPGDTESVLWRQPGWLERSIEPIDQLVDTIHHFNEQQGGGAGESLIMGAGLGGTVGALFRRASTPPLMEFLEREYYARLGLSHTPAVIAEPGKAASVITLPHTPFNGAGLEESASISIAELTEGVSPDRLDRIARVLAGEPRFPVLLEPAGDGEFYPVKPERALRVILADLVANIGDHLSSTRRASARVSVSLSRERVNDHLAQRLLSIRYLDDNPAPFEVPLEEVFSRSGVTRKAGPGGQGLYRMRKISTSDREGRFVIEATDQDGTRKRLSYQRIHGEGVSLPAERSSGTEIIVSIPLGSVALRGGPSLEEEAGRLRDQLAGLEEYITTGDMFVTDAQGMFLPTTVTAPKGGVVLLQWSDGAMGQADSDFALLQVSPDGKTVTLLDKPGEEFHLEQFFGVGVQGMPGVQAPGQVRVVSPWESAARKGTAVAIERAGAQPIPITWRSDTRSMEIGFPRKMNFALHRLDAAPSAGLEEPDAVRWRQATDPDLNLIQSFSGIRAVVGEDVALPVAEPPAGTELSPENRLIFGRYGYLFAQRQISKFQQAQPDKTEFTFVLARDPRPSGGAVLDAQARGMLAAAAEAGVKLTFIDGGVLPTPFAEGLVRMRGADGGVIMTASHNPLLWNGVKYPTAAREPGENPLVQGGILLAAREMSGVVEEFQGWAAQVQGDLSLGEQFARQMDQADPAGLIEPARPDEIAAHMVGEARAMWGLSDDAAFEQFRQRAREVRIVLDPNGGAACAYYAAFLRAFGFTLTQEMEINSTVGQPNHKLEPTKKDKETDPDWMDALADAQTAMAENDADFAVIFDYDADRGNTLIRDRATGAIAEPGPQEVAAMNVAMTLARASIERERTGDTRLPAVVVHDATSRRDWEIAEVFGAELVVVEVGEVNVLEKMRDLERKGYHVVIGVEGANGGSVFRGDDARVLGDTSRNGAMTALFTGMLLVRPEIGRRWLEMRNAKAPQGVDPVPVPEKPTLLDLVKSLPGDRGREAWRFYTPLEKMGQKGDVPKDLVVPFKRALEGIFRRGYWAGWQAQGLHLGGGDFQKFSGFQIIHHAETSESLAYGPNDPAGSGLDRYGQGGWRMELTTPEGYRAFVWFRGSLTEGQVRASAEGQGPEGERIGRALIREVRDLWYPAALKAAQESQQTGLEEVDVLELLRQKDLLGEPTSTKSGFGVIAGPHPNGLAYGVALTRAKDAAGKPVPVVLIVGNWQQSLLASSVAASAHVIRLTDHQGNVEKAVQAARDYLRDVMKVTGQPEEIGVDGPVGLRLLQVLQRLGIELADESVTLWDNFIGQATLDFQA